MKTLYTGIPTGMNWISEVNLYTHNDYPQYLTDYRGMSTSMYWMACIHTVTITTNKEFLQIRTDIRSQPVHSYQQLSIGEFLQVLELYWC